MTSPITFLQYITTQRNEKQLTPELATLLLSVAQTCKKISTTVAQGALADILGNAGSENIQGEEQKKLDVLSNNMLISGCNWCNGLVGIASEEMDNILPTSPSQTTPTNNYLLLFDPLDGSSNIDINVTVGTIFSILKHTTPKTPEVTEQDFLQAGRHQVAAGYCLYGPQTTLVLTIGQGVILFTLDNHAGEFLLTREQITIPEDTQEFAINMSNMRHWAPPVKQYIDECLAGEEGIRGKNFNMRWVAAMVAEVHRILMRGGIFLYPWDQRDPKKPGKLRLMYEANPMSWLIEQAGGKATNGKENILDIQPQKLHERVAVILGARNEVERVTSYHLK